MWCMALQLVLVLVLEVTENSEDENEDEPFPRLRKSRVATRPQTIISPSSDQSRPPLGKFRSLGFDDCKSDLAAVSDFQQEESK